MTLHLVAAATSPREARRNISALVRTWPDACCEVLQVLVAELVTNVVLHARTSATLVASVDGRHARVEVHDQNSSIPTMRALALDSLTGRGLHLIDALAGRWGVDELARGKVVWFEFDCDGSSRSNGGDVHDQ